MPATRAHAHAHAHARRLEDSPVGTKSPALEARLPEILPARETFLPSNATERSPPAPSLPRLALGADRP